MKRFILALSLATLALLNIGAARAAAQEETVPSLPLCLPGIYLDGTDHCLPGGPSAYLNSMAEQGITLPVSPLPAQAPDPALTQVNVRYGQIVSNSAPVYSSLEDAQKKKGKDAAFKITSAFGYISYTDEAVVDGKRYYMIDYGQWMTANDISRIGAVPRFQGLEFHATPPNSFGWVIGLLSPTPVETKRTPGLEQADYTGHIFSHLEVVQVFSSQTVGKDAWYLVGPDEWLPARVVKRVIPNTTPPEGVTNGRWIEVNLEQQTLAVYDQQKMVFATLIASGADPFWTQPGVFPIKQKLDSGPMRGSFEADQSDAYYLEDVPWTMYYDGARALHGAYWRANLGFPQSHGCVNLSVGDAHWIYDWAVEGDWVYVHDPSGLTPTDPSLYGSGGY